MTEQIKRCIAKGKPLAVIKDLLEAEIKRLDKVEFLAQKEAEYNILFPEMRNVTEEEYEADKSLSLNTEMPLWIDLEQEYKDNLKCPIDYLEDETYLSFSDWLSEAIVITEAVDATYDENGLLLTESIEAVTEQVRPYVELSIDEVNIKVDVYLSSIDYFNSLAADTYHTAVKALTDGVPDAEIATWVKQESEANAYMLDNTVSTPFIDAMCAARGIPKDYLVTKILEKALSYAIAVGTLTGIRQKAEDALKV